MSYIRTFTDKLPSLGAFVGLDFSQIESVILGAHHVVENAEPEAKAVKTKGVLVRFRSGNAIFLTGDEANLFLGVYEDFAKDSHQRERMGVPQAE